MYKLHRNVPVERQFQIKRKCSGFILKMFEKKNQIQAIADLRRRTTFIITGGKDALLELRTKPRSVLVSPKPIVIFTTNQYLK